MFSYFKQIIQNFLNFKPTSPKERAPILIDVGWVIDGDSFEATINQNKKTKIRLYAIDAPEKEHKNMPGQTFSKESHQRLKELLGKKTFISPIGTDHFGRTLAIVYPEITPTKYKQGTSINEIMAFEGMAWVNERYIYMHPLGTQIKLLEKEASANRCGLWAFRKTNPQEWRKKFKNI